VQRYEIAGKERTSFDVPIVSFDKMLFLPVENHGLFYMLQESSQSIQHPKT
jgi:hypothetical protein